MKTVQITDEKKVDIVLGMVKFYYRVDLRDIFAKTRKREIVQKRQVAQYLLTKFTHLSLAKIGKRTGGKNHATVLHARKTVEDLMDTQEVIKNDVFQLKQIIENEIKRRTTVTSEVGLKKLDLFKIIRECTTEDDIEESILDFFNLDKNIIAFRSLKRSNDVLKKKLDRYTNDVLSKITDLPDKDYDYFLKNKAEPHLKMLKIA